MILQLIFTSFTVFILGWQDSVKGRGLSDADRWLDRDNHGAVTQGWEEAAIGRS